MACSEGPGEEAWRGLEGVRHVEISDHGKCALPDLSGEMVVYWWKDRPVGHEVIDPDGTKYVTGLVDPDTLEAVRNEERAARVPQLTASVVICTRDRPDALRRCLASLHRQSFPPSEVIVVDNASGDARTRDLALGAGATYVREDRIGLDFARNAGARLASSEIVAYTDDDVVLHRRWLEGLVAAFDRPEVAAVTGLVLPAELATDAQRHFETYWSFGRGYRRKDYDPASFAAHKDSVFPAWEIGAGASMAFRRTIFERIGHFDERLDVGQAGCSGDSELWYRIIATGHTCRYEPRSVAFHFHRRSVEGLASQIHHYMRGHAAALLVQHERTGIAANRVQAWWHMPRWYASRLKRRLRGIRVPEDRFLREEITGYLSGLLFYVRNRQR